MEVVRKRPVKTFRVIKAHGNYRVGAVVQFTGMYRDVMLKSGYIEEVKGNDPTEACALTRRNAEPANDRMVHLPNRQEGRPILHVRGKK